jgi:acid phosphatase class B
MKFSDFLVEGMKVSFDMDDTLAFNADDGPIPREKYINAFKDHVNNGDTVIIVTSRKESPADRKQIEHFMKSVGLPQVPVFFSNGELKVKTIQDQNVNLHYDDDNREHQALKSAGIKYVSSFDDDLVKLWQRHHEMDIDYDM